MADFDEKLNRILSNPEAMAQIARLAQSLDAPPSHSGPPPMTGNAGPPRNPPPESGPPFADVPPSGNGPPPDMGTPPPPFNAETLEKFLPLLRDLDGDSDARRFLYALRPYLRPRRQENIERALRLARLIRVGKSFLSQWEG